MIDRILLFPYSLSLLARKIFYRKGRHSVKADVPTICVGNITAGGTGKTPHTEMILDLLQQSDEWGGQNIAMLSLGYKRKVGGFQQVVREGTAAEYGDEPIQIKRKFPAVTVAVDKNRVRGCRYLAHPDQLTGKKAAKCRFPEWPAANIIVLDDAFQYRKLNPTVKIVLVDYNRPLKKDHLLPFGRLRDLPSRIREADAIIVTKCPYCLDEEERADFARGLGFKTYSQETNTGATRKKSQKLYFSTIQYSASQPVFDNSDPRYIYSQRLVLFTGIANDTPLRNYLSDSYRIMRTFRFPDHHKYTRNDFRPIESVVKHQPTAAVATTEKDAQRVLDCPDVPQTLRERMFKIPITVDFLTPEEKEDFRTFLLDVLRSNR